MDALRIEQCEIQSLYALLESAKGLRESQHAIVAVAAERIVALLVDTLYEVDATMADPWQHLGPEIPPVTFDRVGE